MKVLLAGATGASGKKTLYYLLDDPKIQQITALVRKPIPGLSHEKLEWQVVDFGRSDSYVSETKFDLAICCLGTTIRKAGSKSAFYAVDHDAVLQFAFWAKKTDVKRFAVVSAIGADPNSQIFYSKVKGETEEDLKKIGFNNLIIVQPSLLITPRSERRVGEWIMQKMAPIWDLLIGSWQPNYHSISVEVLAKAIIQALFQANEKVQWIRYKDLKRLGVKKLNT